MMFGKNRSKAFLLSILTVLLSCTIAFASDLSYVQITSNLYQKNGQVVICAKEDGIATSRRAYLVNDDDSMTQLALYKTVNIIENQYGQNVQVGTYAYYYTGITYEPSSLFEPTFQAQGRRANGVWSTGIYHFYRDPLGSLPTAP